MTTEIQADAKAQNVNAGIEFKGAIPYISAKDGPAQLDFYRKAFGAEVVSEMKADDGKRIMHASLAINGGHVMLSDAFPEYGHPWVEPANIVIHLQVDEPQRWYDRALAAGCDVAMPMEVQFWGDRYGHVKDPYGVTWSIGGPA
jgi:uncharacterized glyoxalase superfamily protein PhnB